MAAAATKKTELLSIRVQVETRSALQVALPFVPALSCRSP
jgi:hypothetical protein